MEKIFYKEKRVAYSLSGKGASLVLLHGFCEDSRVWEKYEEAFETYQVVKIDLPGFGQSDLAGEQTIAEMAEAVKAVLDHLSIQRCVMIGHSMGGYVSLAFAKKHESYLSGLGIFHSHPYADTAAGKKNRDKGIEFIKRNNSLLYIKQLIPKLFHPTFAGDHNFLVNKLIHRAIAYRPEAIIQTLEAMRDRPDQSEILANFSCPVLFIIGKKDSVIPIERSLEQSYLPAVSMIKIFSKVGHMGMYEVPKKTAKAICQFIEFCSIESKP